MLNRLPSPVQCPTLGQILDDLGRPDAKRLAKALGTSQASIYRWIANDQAPRPVMLALFWLTRWGMSIVDAEAVNDARMKAALARCLQTENDRLRYELSRVLAVGDFGAANDPTQEDLRITATILPIRA